MSRQNRKKRSEPTGLFHNPRQILPWRDPLDLFLTVSRHGDSCAFLYSSLPTSYSGRYSLLALDTVETLQSDDFTALAAHLEDCDEAWLGYLGYGLRHALEQLPKDAPSYINAPALMMSRFNSILRFDHEARQIEVFGNIPAPSLLEENTTPIQLELLVTKLHTNMQKPRYIHHIKQTLEQISAGAFYQANITRKFFGSLQLNSAPALFAKLCAVSPAPYSAYFQWPEMTVISSSPELFLRVDENRRVTSRPIKGTRRRDMQDAASLKAKEHLATSSKDRAENLMIVDLMRNDLSRVCKPGSVTVNKLFDIDSFSTLHHLSSEISGELADGKAPLHAVMAAFPPGSMTGAPKIAAMRWCSGVEQVERGTYSGALGWISREQAELSVVIRTLVLKGSQFEFQVGGGIVADSVPEAEWDETLVKAKGIATALGISDALLANCEEISAENV